MMQNWLFKRVVSGNGVLDTRDGIYRSSEVEGSLIWEALPSVAPYVQKFSIDMGVLNPTKIRHVETFLLQSIRLLSIQIDCSRGWHFVERVLDAATRSPPRMLSKIMLSRIHVDADHGLVKHVIPVHLGRLYCLREIVIVGCGSEIVHSVCSGLYGHAALRSVCIRCESYNVAELASFLSSLPELESYGDTLIVPGLLELLPVHRLKKLSVDGFAHSQSRELLRALHRQGITQVVRRGIFSRIWKCVSNVIRSNLVFDRGQNPNRKPIIESLKIRTAPEWILQFPSLRSLACTDMETESFESLFSRPSHLSSIKLYRVAFQQSNRILALLETNGNIQHLSLREHELAVDPMTHTETLADQLARTLTLNKSLKSICLDMPTDAGVGRCKIFVVTIAALLKENKFSVEHLELKTTRVDCSPLFQALPTNSTLQGLTLTVYGRLDFSNSWSLLIDYLPQLGTLKKLHLSVPSLVGQDVDRFKEALSRNSSLTSISMPCNPELGLDCQIIGQRNCIQHMIRKDELSPGLWPLVLEALAPNPSSVFLATKYVPWPNLRPNKTNEISM